MSEVAQAPHSSPDGHIPQLRFPEFSGEWGRKLFNNIVDIIDGDRGVNYPKSNDFFNDEYCLFLSAKNVTKNGFIFNETQFITKERDALLRKGKLSRGDIVLTTRGTVGQFAFYSDDVLYDNIRINSGMVLLRNNNDNLLNSYFFKACKSFQISRQIKIVAFGSAQPQLTVKEINKIKISLPAKPEQQKIAAFLTAVDSKIEQLSKKQELLGEYKKGLMQQIFSQAIRFKADDGSDFPDWEEKKLRNVLSSVSTRPYQIKSADILEFGSHKVVDQGQKELAGYTNEKDKLLTNDGVIVYGDHTTIVKFINYDFVVGADGVKLLTSDSNNIKYLYFNLLFNNVGPEGYKRHFSILKNVVLQIPSLPEQNKIANFLSSIDSKIEQVGKQLNESKQFKKALLQQMFV
jgi:type I restriction enzyme S subunit